MFLRLIPGDPAVAMLGEHATEENVNRIREQFGLNRPVFLDREALKNGDFGGFHQFTVLYLPGPAPARRPWKFHSSPDPVAETLAQRFPATIELAFSARYLQSSLECRSGSSRLRGEIPPWIAPQW